MKRIELTWQDVEKQVQELLRQLHQDQWQPDYIVGLTRGGLMPANMLSQYLDVPMETLKVTLRHGGESCESNLWMAEDAVGYGVYDPMCSDDGRKNILIVDDINDSGATLNWIMQDWQSSVAGTSSPDDWQQIWGHNVRIAVLYDNEISTCQLPISYSAVDVNKSADPCWIVFPWEEWWKQKG
jgi:uncharacterized protein